MKRKIILLVFMVLASAFTFGQNELKSQPEKHYKTLHLDRKKAERISRLFDFETKHKPVLKSINAEKQQLSDYIRMKLSSETSQWVNYDKKEYTYDANGNQTVEIDSEWNSETSQWETDYKYEYSYDTNGNPTVIIGTEWNSETSQWENNYKTECTFDANGNPTVIIGMGWNSETSQWENYRKNENTYDANGNPTVIIRIEWNSDTSQWENSYKTEYTYDANENPTAIIETLWISGTSQWDNYYKREYAFDAKGKPTVLIEIEWNIDTSQWDNYCKTEFSYDANGNPTVEIYSNWNREISQWIIDFKYEYTYDLLYSINDLIIPNMYNFVPDLSNLIVNKPVDHISYDYVQGSWLGKWKGTYNYSTVNVASVSDLNAKDCSIYPNPVSDMINIDIVNKNNMFRFELYDSQGRKLISKEITNNGQLSLEGLTKGLYLYSVNIDGEMQRGKLIKE